MRRLFLMRHAKSDWSVGEDDFARPLNKRGRKSASALGAWMRAESHEPDQVLCSASARTRETLDGLDLALSPDAIQFQNPMYLATANELFDALQGATGTSVLMIAHNPGIAEFAACLVARAPAHPRFHDYPTGATLVVDFPVDTWADLSDHSGTVVDFVIPRELIEPA